MEDIFLDRNNDDDNSQLYSNAQQRLLPIVSSVLAPFSIIGSSCIVAAIYKHRRKCLQQTYHRIMLALAVCDILFSLNIAVFGGWSIPRHVDFVVGARVSSQVWCDAAGFLTTLYSAAVWYNMALLLHFVLTIQFKLPPAMIARHVEPWVHLVCGGIPPSLAVLAILRQQMNPLQSVPGRCWLNEYPPQCSENPLVDCQRGPGAEHSVTSLLLGAVTAGLAVGAVVVAMSVLYRQVRTTEVKLRQFVRRSIYIVPLQRTRQTALKGVWYSLAFVVTYVPGIIIYSINKPLTREYRYTYFPWSLLFSLCTPLQGVFNASIYFSKPLSNKWNRFWNMPPCHKQKHKKKQKTSRSTVTLPNGLAQQQQQQPQQRGYTNDNAPPPHHGNSWHPLSGTNNSDESHFRALGEVLEKEFGGMSDSEDEDENDDDGMEHSGMMEEYEKTLPIPPAQSANYSGNINDTDVFMEERENPISEAHDRQVTFEMGGIQEGEERFV